MSKVLEDFLVAQGVISHADVNTNTAAVIVALPSAMDPIRLVGDEDKHATLLYFGETSTLPDDAKATILDTLTSVARITPPFSARIRNVTRLGSDVPPALVAILDKDNLKSIREILQVNPKIGEYLKNVDQHPQYVPHVTLAYPDYQGEAELRTLMQQLYRVSFDRLALWWGPEQIEFNLTDLMLADSAEEVSMSMDFVQDFLAHHGIDISDETKVDTFLAHHGIKGMKWGIRRSRAELAGGSAKSAGSKLKPGSVIVKEHADGTHTTHVVGKDGQLHESHLSPDAEKFMKAHMKQPHEMSDQELRDTLARARMVEDYNKFFNPKQSSELKAQVDHMELQRRYGELHGKLHPSRIAKVSALVASAGSAYLAYKKLDKASGGAASEALAVALGAAGMASGGKHRGVPRGSQSTGKKKK